MIDLPDEEIAAMGVRGPLKLDDVLFVAKKANRLAPTQVVRDDRIVGMDHIRTAVLHALRSMAEGRARAERPEVEFTRYLAARRTIRDAIDHVGLPDGASTGIIVSFGPHRHDAIEHIVGQLGLHEDDALIVADGEHLRAFGVTETQLSATSPARRLDIVLEMVASVDLMRS